MNAVASNVRHIMKLIVVKYWIRIGTTSDETGVLSLTISMKINRPSKTEMMREIRSPESAEKRNEMLDMKERKIHGTMIPMM